MGRAGPAAGGGRWVEVSPERITRWLTGFAERHAGAGPAGTAAAVGRSSGESAPEVAAGPRTVRFWGADGTLAECRVPFPPLEIPKVPADARFAAVTAALAAHACRERRVGVVLVRLGGYAVGVFEGERLVASKVGSRLVHGRSAAGGQSQQRFARRRDKQAREALQAAADVTVRVLSPYVVSETRGGVVPGRGRAGEVRGGLDAVVFGGDRRAIDALRDDRRLAMVFALAADQFLTVPDPKFAVLKQAPRLFRAVRIRIVEPRRP